jgi:glycosyltransferase involved in cell wall biosynthesis
MKRQLRINELLLMYVGNLEPYQGIDLLLESFALALKQTDQPDLVIIGGGAPRIQTYQEKCSCLGIQEKVHFLGPKPVKSLGKYLSEADILVAPRIRGQNTPMKLYSYLHSGKAILATNLLTHTQVLNRQVAMLAEPTPEAFSKGMVDLLKDKTLRLELGTAAKTLIEEKYSHTVFFDKLNNLYNSLKIEVDR